MGMTALYALLLAGASISAQAATITFDDLGVAPGDQLNPAAGVGVVSFGFNYTPGPNNASGFNDLHMDNGLIGPANGTTIGGSHDDVVLTQVGGGTFSLQGFDFAGFAGGEVPFTVVGSYFGGGSIIAAFTPDGISDNLGPLVDFQHFTLGPGWSNLTAVTWNHTGAGTVQGAFYLDNIEVDAAVPEPMSLLLLGTGLGAMRLAARRRKKA
jgi:hypothetical protein